MLDVLEIAVLAGGRVLKHYFRNKFTTSTKDTPINIVTQADIESQQIITETILTLMKKKGIDEGKIGFIGEESLHIDGEHTFIIDPLDGTTNFAVGLDYFCIPIAYAHNGVIEASVVYDSPHDTLYSAEKRKGTYRKHGDKRSKLTVPDKPLNQTVLVAHLSTNKELREKQLPLLTQLQAHVLGIRFCGAVALDHCYFTDGIFGAVLNSRTYIWDTAATRLIIEEAGGALVDWEGHELVYDFNDPEKTYNSLAIHPKNLPQLLKFFA